MYHELSQLILYAPAEDSILRRMAELCRRDGHAQGDIFLRELCGELRRLFTLSVELGFTGNLWQSYLTWEILRSENPWSLACEGRGDPGGTLSLIARHDLDVFRRLFAFSFDPFRRETNIHGIAGVLDFDPGTARAEGEAGALLRETRDALAACGSAEAFAAAVSGCYRDHGAGNFAFDRAFRVAEGGTLSPIRGLPDASLSDIVGYELQKRRLAANTEAFLAGRPANNVLLYGDGGTGKSTCVRALLREYARSGLRMIELYKHQFHDLPAVIARIRGRNYRFILFIDDLSFEEHEIEYKYLKAVIEGGVEARPENVLLYATSNRRHIIRETWNDRADMEHSGDIHRSDTVEEKLSLASRFGEAINFSAPDRKLYHEIVRALARERLPFPVDDEELIRGANAWEIRHGGVSGRTARQYIDHLAGFR